MAQVISLVGWLQACQQLCSGYRLLQALYESWLRLVLCTAEVLLSRSDVADLRAVQDACIDTALPGIVGWSHEMKRLKTGVHADLVKQASDLISFVIRLANSQAAALQ